MIKFLGTVGDREVLGLGLSRDNCDKLLEGKPIKIDLEKMLAETDQSYDLNKALVLIFGGETEADMQLDLYRITGSLPTPRTHREEN